MTIFKFMGKKKNFKLDPLYEYQKKINPGDEFELEGKDLGLMKRCLEIAALSDESPPDFILKDQFDLEQAEIEKEESVQYEDMKKTALIELCDKRTISLEQGMLKEDIIKLLKDHD